MARGGKRRTDARTRRQGAESRPEQHSGDPKLQVPGRASRPMIVYWDFDAVGGDGSTEEVYEIDVANSDTQIKFKKERKQR